MEEIDNTRSRKARIYLFTFVACSVLFSFLIGFLTAKFLLVIVVLFLSVLCFFPLRMVILLIESNEMVRKNDSQSQATIAKEPESKSIFATPVENSLDVPLPE